MIKWSLKKGKIGGSTNSEFLSLIPVEKNLHHSPSLGQFFYEIHRIILLLIFWNPY